MLEESDNQTLEIKKQDKKHSSDHDRYKTLFESINAGVFITSIDGKIIESNLKSCDLFRYKWEELSEMHFEDIFPEHIDWSQLKEEIMSKGGMNFETENRRKDGSIFPVMMDTSLFTLNGKPVMLALIWDITERKEAERKIRESEEKYEGLFESTTDGMLVLDARGEILDINSKALYLFGKNEEEMIGKNFLSMGLLTPKALSIVVKHFQDLLSNEEAVSKETEIFDKNNNPLTVELTSFFLIRKDNEIDNFVLVIRDISDRKKTETKLAREHELLQTLMDSIPDLVYFKDDENKFIKVNKAKADYCNSEPDNMIGKTDFDFLPPDEAQKAFKDDEEILKTGKFIVDKHEKITKEDGTANWFIVTKIPRFDTEGSVIGTMGISRNITQWKEIEEKLEEEKTIK